eukprot:5557240-Karenia_brevis.AAC.1
MLERLPKPIPMRDAQTTWSCIDALNLEAPITGRDKAPIVERQSPWLRKKMLEQSVANISKRKSYHNALAA